jgi:uncharacterized protein YqeY
MSILSTIQADVKDAMRARDSEKLTSLRMFVAALQNEAKDKMRDLTEQEEIAVLSRERKRRVEAAEGFDSGGAAERAAAERYQVGLVDAYLPAQMEQADLDALVDSAVAEVGATSPQEMGAVMKVLMPKIAGRADGKAVSASVKRALAEAGQS